MKKVWKNYIILIKVMYTKKVMVGMKVKKILMDMKVILNKILKVMEIIVYKNMILVVHMY
jgi:hypothetical protein